MSKGTWEWLLGDGPLQLALPLNSGKVARQ